MPVQTEGGQVAAVLLVLRNSISEQEAADILCRREIGRVGNGEIRYKPRRSGPNQVCIERLTCIFNMDVVLYTRIEPNIIPLTAQELARRAIESAKRECGARETDGIHYLLRAKQNGIETPLTPDYEREILNYTGEETLENAWRKIRREVN